MPPSIPLHRICGLVAVLSLTVLPLASCGPVKIYGHELLRNTMDNEFGALMKQEGGAQPDATLFSGEHAWLHYTYIGATASTVVAAAAPLGSLTLAAGAVALIALSVFGYDILKDDDADMITLAFGTWLAYAGLLGLVYCGAVHRRT